MPDFPRQEDNGNRRIPARSKNFYVRFRVKGLGVPVLTQRDRLSFFQNMVSPIAWTGQFRGSPKEFKRRDAEVIVADLRAAQANPVPGSVAETSRQPGRRVVRR
ncbi:MAG: hypothetical protein WBP56_04790 [Polyangia bacterium]